MADKALMRQPFNYQERNELRSLFKEYLRSGDGAERLTWETITRQDGLPHNWIYDIYQDSTGRIWVGTWGGGLALLQDDRWTTYKKTEGLHCNEVTCIREDSRGKIWIATDDGLNTFDGHRIENAGLAGKSLLNITFDKQGNLWAGCWRATRTGGGLFRFDGRTWETFSTRSDLPGLEILKVFEDSRGDIWVGTYEHGSGAGVGRFDGEGWHSYNRRDGLVNDCVYSMFEDPSGNMWFGTIGGVSIFDGSKWHKLTRKDGLVDNRVYCMMIDSQKKMWFGTEGGVSRFDGEEWISYTKKDGLVENLVRAIIETHDGDLWFGTYPYERGKGGISIARYQGVKSLPDRLLRLLPDQPEIKKLEPGDDD
jgi:ligand-binding sensor domain-containing protein